MRISVHDMSSEDPERRALCRRVIIKLDGVKQEGCIEADDEAGYVDVLLDQKHPDFQKKLQDARGESWPHERKYGKVEIIDQKEPQA